MKHAKSLISQADYYPKDGDQLWCVFDCDDNKDSELQAAISYSEKHGYKSHIPIRHLNIGICSILKNGMDI